VPLQLDGVRKGSQESRALTIPSFSGNAMCNLNVSASRQAFLTRDSKDCYMGDRFDEQIGDAAYRATFSIVPRGQPATLSGRLINPKRRP
jgi:hypothetical protein